MTDSNAVMLVLKSPQPGAESSVTRQFDDICRSPQVIAGDLAHCIDDADGPRWSAAGYFRLDGNPATILDEFLARSLTADASMLAIGTALTDRVRSRITPEAIGKERLLFIVLTNSTPGNDTTFNAWYTDRHIPDVLDVPGFVAARRFRLIDHPALQPCPYRYMAVYEVLASQADAAFGELNARAGTDKMYLSPTLEMSDVYAASFAVDAVCGSD